MKRAAQYNHVNMPYIFSNVENMHWKWYLGNNLFFRAHYLQTLGKKLRKIQDLGFGETKKKVLACEGKVSSHLISIFSGCWCQFFRFGLNFFLKILFTNFQDPSNFNLFVSHVNCVLHLFGIWLKIVLFSCKWLLIIIIMFLLKF